MYYWLQFCTEQAVVPRKLLRLASLLSAPKFGLDWPLVAPCVSRRFVDVALCESTDAVGGAQASIECHSRGVDRRMGCDGSDYTSGCRDVACMMRRNGDEAMPPHKPRSQQPGPVIG